MTRLNINIPNGCIKCPFYEYDGMEYGSYGFCQLLKEGMHISIDDPPNSRSKWCPMQALLHCIINNIGDTTDE